MPASPPAPCRTRAARSVRWRTLLVATALAGGPSVGAAQDGPGLEARLAADIEATGARVVALARAIPEAEWGWRPAPGVRSVQEVVEHLAFDHFYFPTAVGVAAPEGTGIDADYATARAWGARDRTPPEALAALEASLDHLRSAVLGSATAAPEQRVRIFDREMDRAGLWLMAAGHLHEHLGQLIAYARGRGVVPPWSRPAPGGGPREP